MASTDNEDGTTYVVVINTEEQYSIWPKYKAVPPGWKALAMEGPKADCLRFVDEHWTDMRPLSLRRAMEGR
jgi:MbtH protein